MMIEISKAEFEVLNAIWQNHPASAQDVISRLADEQSWHEKTIKTLLNRLVKKGALEFHKEGRRYLYTPTIGQEDYTLKESKSLIEKLFKGRVAPLVTGFAKHGELSKEDINELKAVIKQWEQEND